MAVNLVGALGCAISFILWLPQAKRIWAVRHDGSAMSSVSPGTYWLVLANAVLWAVYAALTGAWWSGAPGLVNAPLAVLVLILVARSRLVPNQNHCLCDVSEGCEHDYLVTAPPGAGTVHSPCRGVRVPGMPIVGKSR